jgi:hypothetical protein
MSGRREAIEAALRRIAPRIPGRDRRDIVEHALGSKGLRQASPEAAAWLSLVAYIRHALTEYDVLLAEGYGPEAARHFTQQPIEAILIQWGCAKRLG